MMMAIQIRSRGLADVISLSFIRTLSLRLVFEDPRYYEGEDQGLRKYGEDHGSWGVWSR